MKLLRLVLLSLVLASAAQAQAQIETFDMIRFTTPREWQREAREGGLVFSKVDQSKNTFCLLAVYESRGSSGAIQTDFENEWQDRVANPLETKAMPAIQKADAPEGWQALIGAAQVESGGAKMAAMLTVFHGHGRVVSILITLNDAVYQQELEEFLSTLELTGTPTISSNRSTGRQTGQADSGDEPLSSAGPKPGTHNCQVLTFQPGTYTPTYIAGTTGKIIIENGRYRSPSYNGSGSIRFESRTGRVIFTGGPLNGWVGALGSNSLGPFIRFNEWATPGLIDCDPVSSFWSATLSDSDVR